MNAFVITLDVYFNMLRKTENEFLLFQLPAEFVLLVSTQVTYCMRMNLLTLISD